LEFKLTEEGNKMNNKRYYLEFKLTEEGNKMNNKRYYLELKLTEEGNKNINDLDRNNNNNNNLQLGIYRKPTQTDTTTHFTSNHPLEHKLAAYTLNCYINRMLTTPATEQARQQEWKTICTIARSYGFPLQIVQNLENKLILNTQKTKIHPRRCKERNGSHLRITD
jgi:hypothetical protein